ncbi:tRNA (uracil-5-)-methyltransferase homolog A-like [Uranotaenia lowii]|uniref:tRNA (uracil-5-)-methyltransferase homolog A-like n=1 Tax=Uranotaenia lowii TaxID=190385 RepID=UPI002479B0BD|nr:tRNA (uracil-5-)-methyltransferase homolog A-like [Uranotaenia lowii]
MDVELENRDPPVEVETVGNEVAPSEPSEVNQDEYAYLDATGFTSERFKIEIKNLPKYYGISELKKLLNKKLNLATSKIKIMDRGCPFIFVCFRGEPERQNAIKAVNGYSWKGKTLTAVEAKPSPDPLVKRRREAERDPMEVIKKRKTVEESVTSLAYLSYDDQIKQKQSEMQNILVKFSDEVWKNCPNLRPYVEAQRKEYEGMICPLEEIRRSPKIDGYRNKCEFSIGKNSQGEVTIGFRMGAYCKGVVEVEGIANLKHISDKMKGSVQLFEEFVRASKYEPYSAELYTGHFRLLTVRTSSATGQVMVIVGFHPQQLTANELKDLKSSIVDCLTSEKAKQIGISSVYFEPMEKKTSGSEERPMEHLSGDTHIVEEIHGLKFRISPKAFFQINTPGTEVLYQSAIDMASTDDKTTILDICCGTGTIGLCFARHCKQVFGVEIIDQAIEDAKHNAELNDVKNCNFFAGNADDLIMSLVRKANVQEGEKLVAIVDPPRAGLHVRSITQLRNARGLNRLIYVSCSPKSALKNWFDLVRPASKTLRGSPFVAKKAIAVDLFPHTPHTELMILFEREPDTDAEGAVTTVDN